MQQEGVAPSTIKKMLSPLLFWSWGVGIYEAIAGQNFLTALTKRGANTWELSGETLRERRRANRSQNSEMIFKSSDLVHICIVKDQKVDLSQQQHSLVEGVRLPHVKTR
jgi:hypothetical protein